MPCNANKTEICGGANRLNIYDFNMTALATPSSSISVSTAISTIAAATGFPSGWTSQGCWVDGPNGRIMPTFQAPDSQTLTQQSCAQLCYGKGYNVSGTEYYTQCFVSTFRDRFLLFLASIGLADTLI